MGKWCFDRQVEILHLGYNIKPNLYAWEVSFFIEQSLLGGRERASANTL